MCGLAGLIDPNFSMPGTVISNLAVSMADRVRHRGPDEAGRWFDGSAGVALAFRRLAIVDRSAAGHQPMASADGRYVVMLNGEIYNASDLRSDVDAARGGINWRGHSDTEALVEAIALWGFEAAIIAGNGMFAVAAWDRKERSLFLARDRMGKKPLHYGWAGSQFVFASELKALLAHPWLDRAVNAEAAAQSIQLGYVLGNHSIYSSVCKLPPGHTLRLRHEDAIRGHSPAPECYWSQRRVAVHGLATQASGHAATNEELDWLLDDAVQIRREADVPIGTFLSGGIDSSLVTERLARVHPSLQTFSVGFEGATWDEAPHALEVARHLQTRHRTLYIGANDVLPSVLRLAETFDEPFADHSAIPMLMLSHFARRDVTVALSGDGGDELFGGYDRYLGVARWLARRAAVPAPARPLLHWLSRDVAAPMASRLGRNQAVRRFDLFGSLMADGRATAFCEQIALHLSDPRELLPGSTAASRPLRAFAHELPLGTAMDEVLLLESQTALIDDILTKVDRTSMAASLEVRCPLLDHRIVELSWRMPYSAKVRDGVGKAPLRDLLFARVPRALVERPKIGFGAPIELWLRSGLRDWAAELMSPTALARSGLLDVRAAGGLWEDFARGRSFRPLLWHVLMFQAWQQAATASSAQTSALSYAA